jgi:23S rRNA (guanosine2251-2'-O)-methyltransferase
VKNAKNTGFNKKGGERKARPTQERVQRSQEVFVDENVISGRNAVKELLNSGRDIEKIYIQSGEREGSINQLVAEASARRIPFIELDKARLDRMCVGARHQGIIAIASEQNYSTVEEILEYAAERGEAPFIVLLDGVEDPHNF